MAGNEDRQSSEAGVENEEEKEMDLENWLEKKRWDEGVEVKGRVGEVVALGAGDLLAFSFEDRGQLQLFDGKERKVTQVVNADEGLGSLKGGGNTLAFNYRNKAVLVYKLEGRRLSFSRAFLPQEGGFTASTSLPSHQDLPRSSFFLSWEVTYHVTDRHIAIEEKNSKKERERFIFSLETGQLLREESITGKFTYFKDRIFKVGQGWLFCEGLDGKEERWNASMQGVPSDLTLNVNETVVVGSCGRNFCYTFWSWYSRDGAPFRPSFSCYDCKFFSLHPSEASLVLYNFNEKTLSLLNLRNRRTLWSVPLDGFPPPSFSPLCPTTLLLVWPPNLSLIDLTMGSISPLPVPYKIDEDTLIRASTRACVVRINAKSIFYTF